MVGVQLPVLAERVVEAAVSLEAGSVEAVPDLLSRPFDPLSRRESSFVGGEDEID